MRAPTALIITADTDEMAAIEAVIHRLDIRRAQVLVEAIIVEMEVIDGQDLGMQWLFADQSGAFGSNINASDARARNIGEAILPGGRHQTMISTCAAWPALWPGPPAPPWAGARSATA